MATPTEQLVKESTAPVNTTGVSQGYDSTQPVRSTASATYTPTGYNDPANVQAYNQGAEQNLNAMYDANRDRALAQLKTTSDQKIANEQMAMDKIAPQYQESANTLGATYERQRRNNNLQALANGLNTGAGSQMQLAAANAYQANQGALETAKNRALAEAEQRITNLRNEYQNDVAAALADNDAQRAAALYNEYQNAYQRQLQAENTNFERTMQAEQQAYNRAFQEENRDYTRRFNEEQQAYNRAFNEDQRDYERAWNAENRDYTRAFNEDQRDYERAWNTENRDYTRAYNEDQRAYERAWNEENRDYTRTFNEDARNYDRQQQQATQLAQYGDFSGFAALYGEDVARQMERTWLLNNPALAYTLGKISADEYFRMTGKPAPGTAVAAEESQSSSRGYGGGYVPPNDTQKADTTYTGVKNALELGYTYDDIINAANNTKLADQQYQLATGQKQPTIAPASGGARGVGGATKKADATETSKETPKETPKKEVSWWDNFINTPGFTKTGIS